MSTELSIEARKVWELSDEQLLKALRQRNHELNTAKALGTLVRLFEHAKGQYPDFLPGLELAVGLTKLYSQNFAPGNEQHPFPSFKESVQDMVTHASLYVKQPEKKGMNGHHSIPPVLRKPSPPRPSNLGGGGKVGPNTVSKMRRGINTIMNSEWDRVPNLKILMETLRFDSDLTYNDIFNSAKYCRNKGWVLKVGHELRKIGNQKPVEMSMVSTI